MIVSYPKLHQLSRAKQLSHFSHLLTRDRIAHGDHVAVRKCRESSSIFITESKLNHIFPTRAKKFTNVCTAYKRDSEKRGRLIGQFANTSRTSRLAKEHRVRREAARIEGSGGEVDRGILTPRKTRFYSRLNKLKHKPLVRGSPSEGARAPSHLQRAAHTFSLTRIPVPDILQRRLQTTRTRLRRSHARGLSMPGRYLARCPVVVDANLSPGLGTTAAPLRVVKIYFFLSLARRIRRQKKALDSVFIQISRILRNDRY